MKVFIDADSIAYAAAYSDDWATLKRSVDLKMSRILADCKTTEFECWIEPWLGVKRNFRNHIAYSQTYKGKRKQYKTPEDREKGMRLMEMVREAKKHLAKSWNAKIADNCESEDMCVIRSYEHGIENSILACIDKDLLCHPLTFYNYGETNQLGRGLGVEIPPRSIYKVSEEEATLHLFRQMLTGDSTDSIEGIKGIGKVNACRIIDNAAEALKTAASTYIAHKKDYKYFIEQYNLLYIRKDRDFTVKYPLSKEEYKQLGARE